MVTDGVSRPEIKHYLIQWVGWWAKTSDTWKKSELANRYVESCWNINMAAMGAAVFQRYLTLSCNDALVCWCECELVLAA